MRGWRRSRASTALWIAAAIWCCVLFYFSGRDGAQSRHESLFLTHLVLRMFPSIPLPVDALDHLLRKLAHFGIFGVEGALLGGALLTSLDRRAPACGLGMLGCALLGVLNEFHQLFVPGRDGKPTDVLIDAAGGIAGVLFALLLYMLIRRARRARGHEIRP